MLLKKFLIGINFLKNDPLGGIQIGGSQCIYIKFFFMRRKDCQKLADRYLDLYATAYALLQDSTDTEDAVQEALTRTMSKVVLDDPYSYCRRVLINHCYDTLRYKKRFIHFHPLHDMAIPTDENKVKESLLDQIKLKIEQLPERTKKILEMYYSNDLTLPMIAEKTKIPLTTVKKIFNKAHRQIKQELIDQNIQSINTIYHERD